MDWDQKLFVILDGITDYMFLAAILIGSAMALGKALRFLILRWQEKRRWKI